MRLYYQVNVFTDRGEFMPDEILNMIAKNRKNFFIFFPRVCRLNEVVAFQKFLSHHKDLSFCIHDKNMLMPDNEVNVGRNVAFYTMLLHSGAQIENISFHMGSMIGFGAYLNDKHIDSLLQYSLPESLANERFLIADFTPEEYIEFYERSIKCIRNLKDIFRETGLNLLIKNFSIDNVVVSGAKKQYFYDLNYKHGVTVQKTFPFPVVLEKGDFPRAAGDILSILEECDVGFSLDMEHLQNVILFSQKYHIYNEALMQEWRIPHITPEQDKFIKQHGFMLRKGYPILYEKPLDLYDLINALRNKIDIAHLSGSVGPVFLDKYEMTAKDLSPENLMGQLAKEDIPYACLGKEQQIQLRQSDDPTVQFNDNFKNHASQRLWQERFGKQFLETILILKEIKCKRIVQKMKYFSESSVETYEVFRNLSDVDD